MSFQLVTRSVEKKRSNVDSELGFDLNRHRIQPERHRLTWLSGLHERAQVNFPQQTTPSRRTEAARAAPQVPANAALSRAGSVSRGRSLFAEANQLALYLSNVAVNKTRFFNRRGTRLKKFRGYKGELTWFAAVEAYCGPAQMRLGPKITLDLCYSVINHVVSHMLGTYRKVQVKIT